MLEELQNQQQNAQYHEAFSKPISSLEFSLKNDYTSSQKNNNFCFLPFQTTILVL